MQTNKSLAKDSKSKKRKILLGTLIPLGVLAVATAVVVPLVVTQCSSKLGPNEERFDIKDVSIVYYINNNNTGGTLYAFMYRGKESTYIVKMDFITLSDDLADGTIYTKDGWTITFEGSKLKTKKLVNWDSFTKYLIDNAVPVPPTPTPTGT